MPVNAAPTEYQAVRHILSAPSIHARTNAHVRADDFDWAGLSCEAQSMSGGERLLVDIARDLWHAEKNVAVWQVGRSLGPTNFRRVVDALNLYRGEAEVA